MYLWLIRHAKSSWADPGQKDFDRPLNDRGERDGPVMRAFLARQSHPADWLWYSPARRAADTAVFVSAAFGIAEDRRVPERELYMAAPETLLDVIRRTPEDVENVALVAHNPGITELSNLLAPDHPISNVPTFGVVRFRCRGNWHELAPGQAQFAGFASPKALADLA